VSTISASVTNQPITATVSASGAVTASVGSTAVSVAVGGGIGPQGPQGESGVSTWNDIAGKPSTFPPSTHQHVVGDVTGLQAALDGKQAAGSYAAAVHAHGISDVTGLQTALDGKAATSHGHAIADVSGLQTAIDGKQASGSYAAASHTHALSALTQSSATSGQVVTWSGSAWTAADTAVPATLDGNESVAAALLLHCDGANGGTTFTESSPNTLTVTAVGDAAISTAQGKFGGASLGPRTGSSGLVIRDGATEYAELLLNGDFTIEFWLRLNDTSSFCFSAMSRWQGAGTKALAVWHHTDWPGKLTIFGDDFSSGSPLLESTSAISLGQWTHCVAQRSGNTFSIWLNGVKDAEVTQSLVVEKPIAIVGGYLDGSGSVGAFAQNNYIDELRIIKGTAVYAANFTPPTAPYSAGTVGTTMQQRRGTAVALAGVTLASGQIAYESDTGKIKVGDGATVYSSLSYVGGVSAWADITGKPSFATVATSGAYADLTGKPTLGTAAAAATTDFAAASHAHGNVTSAGAIGSTSGQIVVTTTAGALTTAASISTSQVSGLGSLATQSGTFSGTSSGTNTGDQTITLTGDVTGSGTGSFAATLSSTGVSAGTYTSVTVDAKGRVTAGSSPAVAYSSLSGVPSTFAPSSHTHSLSDLSQSGATTNQVPQWNGSAWVPATVSGGGGSSSASDLTSGTLADARLSDKARAAENLFLWSNFR
jgi:hypothetical protein